MLQIPSLTIVWCMIMLKNSKDLLQGISKLDYLLKVSVFQKYKDKNLENRKWTMFTDGMDSSDID